MSQPATPNATELGSPTQRSLNWVVDFWRSQLSTGSYEIKNLATIDHRSLYSGALQGTVNNAAVTELLCHFDYLRDSRAPQKATSGPLRALAEKIVRFSLLDRLVGVRQLTFTEGSFQGGHEVPLANISSGNAYLVQRLLSLLGRMYSLRPPRSDPATIHETPGLLMIDEAENHLHPIWQKRLIPGIREIFPNLQIIAATHSPFVLASVPDARVYVCRYEPDSQRCTVSEETAAYQNKPVDEILASPAFDETLPAETRSASSSARATRPSPRETARRGSASSQLLTRNPTYFAHFEIDREIEALRRAG
ncbi:MAG: AAA family ATPase [Polyangiales bacterium]